LFRFLFGRAQKHYPWYRVVFWWEIRRILYNIVLYFSGWLGSAVAYLAIKDYPAREGTDLGDPLLGLILYVFMANVCYTAGWIVELSARRVSRSEQPDLGPRLFVAGLTFSAALTFLLPALFALLLMLSA
jgi:hypothetical protein